MKTCTKCKEEKELTEFYKNCTAKDGFRPHCKACVSAHAKKYKEKNPEKVRASHRKYRKNNREKCRAAVMLCHRNNREKYLASKRKWKKKKRKTCPMFRMIHCLRNRIRDVLRGRNKSASTMALLGCTIEKLKKYIQNQFVDGMTWDNIGTTWHMDHMLPVSLFDLSDPEQQRRCFHYSNLQPLFASDNISKGNKNIYGPYMKWEGDQWHININGEYMSRSRMVEERIPIQYLYPLKWMVLKFNA